MIQEELGWEQRQERQLFLCTYFFIVSEEQRSEDGKQKKNLSWSLEER